MANATRAPPDERGGNRQAKPKTTAPHPYSTEPGPLTPAAAVSKRAKGGARVAGGAAIAARQEISHNLLYVKSGT